MRGTGEAPNKRKKSRGGGMILGKERKGRREKGKKGEKEDVKSNRKKDKQKTLQ